MICLTDLDVFYGAEHVLHHITVTVQKHEILALIGPSGCGKSTLLYSINRLLEERGGHAHGSIMLDDLDILSADPQLVRKRIGMVFQNPTPFPFSVYKNISLPLLYHCNDLKQKNVNDTHISLLHNKLSCIKELYYETCKTVK